MNDNKIVRESGNISVLLFKQNVCLECDARCSRLEIDSVSTCAFENM